MVEMTIQYFELWCPHVVTDYKTRFEYFQMLFSICSAFWKPNRDKRYSNWLTFLIENSVCESHDLTFDYAR